MSTQTIGTTAKTSDTKLMRLKRWLAYYQSLPGALAHNNVSSNDTYSVTLKKIIRSIKGI